jgi:tetratricopeptide (TPR) repeat protein
VSATEVDDILFHLRLGQDLYRRGLYADAKQEYEKALDLNPNYPDIHNLMGLANSASGNLDEALECFRRALEVNPAYADARLHMAVTLRELGKDAEAAREFAAVLEQDKGNTIAQRNLDEMGKLKAA